jgi:hypothetical protein
VCSAEYVEKGTRPLIDAVTVWYLIITDHFYHIVALLVYQGWGAPTALMQLAHLSSNWFSAELYWIDEGGALIFRKLLRMGDRHSELTSADHVWLLNVTRRESTTESSSSGDEQYAFIFQPCQAALRKSKMTTIVWIPRKSVTLSQRDITPTVPQHKQKNATSHIDDPEPATPMFQIQIL